MRLWEHRLGIEGLALLRLRYAEDASIADKVVEELRAVLASAQDPEAQAERRHHYPVLDPAEGYARWAAVYDLPGNPVVAHEEPHARELMGAAEPILDAACGTGRHLAWLKSQGRLVIGVDQSTAMLTRAYQNAPSADLRQGRLEHLPVEDSSVAGVVCALALEHAADLGPAFREFRRVLRPDGWLVVSVMHPLMAQIPGWTAWFIDESGRADVATYPHSVSDYINAGLDAGFDLRQVREVPLDLSPFENLGPPTTEFGTRIAVDGLPLVLLLQLQARN